MADTCGMRHTHRPGCEFYQAPAPPTCPGCAAKDSERDLWKSCAEESRAELQAVVELNRKTTEQRDLWIERHALRVHEIDDVRRNWHKAEGILRKELAAKDRQIAELDSAYKNLLVDSKVKDRQIEELRRQAENDFAVKDRRLAAKDEEIARLTLDIKTAEKVCSKLRQGAEYDKVTIGRMRVDIERLNAQKQAALDLLKDFRPTIEVVHALSGSS